MRKEPSSLSLSYGLFNYQVGNDLAKSGMVSDIFVTRLAVPIAPCLFAHADQSPALRCMASLDHALFRRLLLGPQHDMQSHH